MTVLVLGVPDSGKSKRAEEIAIQLSGGFDSHEKRIYIATMIPFGEEGKRRVEKHRKMREGKGFETIECPVKIGGITDKDTDISTGTCLLECMSNLIGNEMHSEENLKKTDEELIKLIMESVMSLKKKAKNLVIVSNSFPLEDEAYDEDTRKYVRLIDSVNSELIKIADRVENVLQK